MYYFFNMLINHLSIKCQNVWKNIAQHNFPEFSNILKSLILTNGLKVKDIPFMMIHPKTKTASSVMVLSTAWN